MITAEGWQATGPGDPRYGAPGTDAAAAAEDIGIPELVIVPAHPASREDGVVFETREAAGGQPVLPVFSSVRQLVGTLGHAQPWVAMPLIKVRELAAAAGLREVVLDPAAAPGAWLWKSEDLEAWQEDRR
jgi:hypothetical protein